MNQFKVKNNYDKNVRAKRDQLHEAIENIFYTDVGSVMKNLNYIHQKEFRDIRWLYRHLYGEDFMDDLRSDLLVIDYSIIEKRIIPYPESPFWAVVMGILAYAGMMYLILSA